MFDNIHEECGVFGVYTEIAQKNANTVYYGLYALQHRGQESCGIVVNDSGVFSYHKGIGLVNEVFDGENLGKLPKGRIAIGHVRYSTTGNTTSANIQPLVVRHIKGPMAIAHNGNLVNALELRRSFELQGAIFHSTNDTEVISYAITQARLNSGSIQEAVEKAMYKIKGAYSLIIMSAKKMILARDPNGFRPLCIGRLPDGGIAAASESCALDSVGAEYIRDIEPGEIAVISEKGMESIKTHCGGKSVMCVFEYVYIARPDSVIAGQSVHGARVQAGRFLAKEHPVEADIVVGVPDSGLEAALGYSLESGIPYGVGFVRNRYVGRTFIQPAQGMRDDSVRIKLNPVADAVRGKRVVMIDDSIVRGTTCGRTVNLLREAGAREVHVRISSPPFISPCFFGIDIDSRDKLIACRMSLDEIRRSIHADSLGYLSPENVLKIAPKACCGFCSGCFTGKYPIEVPDEMPKDKFESKIVQQ